jgi:AcrR family transcriptional regulator
MTDALDEIPAPGRQRINRGSEMVRRRLIESAIVEFAARGFAGASTRAIAEKADAHQSQIKYHFDTKDELWRRCIQTLFAELDDAIEQETARADPSDPGSIFEAVVGGFICFAAARPDLNRMMMHESTSPSDRLSWMVDVIAAPRYNRLRDLWGQVQGTGTGAAIEPDLVYHVLVGAASVLYAHSSEASLLGIDPSDPALIEHHTEALIAMFLPGRPATPTERA